MAKVVVTVDLEPGDYAIIICRKTDGQIRVQYPGRPPVEKKDENHG